MTTVHKYSLQLEDYTTVSMPQYAELLTVGEQNDQLMLWARVNTNCRTEVRRFRVVGTGHPEAVGKYVGTALLHGGHLVLHVFDVTPSQSLADFITGQPLLDG